MSVFDYTLILQNFLEVLHNIRSKNLIMSQKLSIPKATGTHDSVRRWGLNP